MVPNALVLLIVLFWVVLMASVWMLVTVVPELVVEHVESFDWPRDGIDPSSIANWFQTPERK